MDVPSATRNYQVAAVPIRLDVGGFAEVCLVTSRDTGRWIIPKGWPMRGLRDDKAAAIEAEEEAGVKGTVLYDPIGTYSYWRRTTAHFESTTVVTYLLRAKRLKKRWKEMHQRKVEWVPLMEAADRVLEPELSTLLLDLLKNEKACDFIGKGRSIQF